MALDDTTIWFNVAITDGLGPVAAQKIVRWLASTKAAASDLGEMSAEELQAEIGLSNGVARALADQLQRPVLPPSVPEEVALVVPGGEWLTFDRVADANPAISVALWAAGNLDLLARPYRTLGVAGSRDTSEEVLELVRALASEASNAGWLVVSGLAAGVDSAAHTGAIDGGTGTIGVLASGILGGQRAWSGDLESMCLVSQFMPSEPWSGPRAMQRNSTIASLSDRVFIAASGASGGSWEMGQLCLKRGKPLFVLDLDPGVAEGNRRLIKAGATPVDPENPAACLDELEPASTLF